MVRAARLPFLAFLLPALAAAQIPAGSDTRGGAIENGRILRVTTLADDGAGSLREALEQTGPRVIVFDVAGPIRLSRDVKIASPFVTIAGQTAPDPGITLTGASLRVRSHDVVIQHIAIRPGPAESAEENGNRDGLTIGGGKTPAYDIRVENVSISWAVDENVSISGATTRGVTFRNSLVAEALNHAGHPKGAHSMGLLVNEGAQGIAVLNNLFVSNMYRNPALARGVSALVAGNVIVNPGRGAVHFYAEKRSGSLRASIIGNQVFPGADTSPRLAAVQIPPEMVAQSPDARIYISGNVAPAGALRNDGQLPLARKPPVFSEGNPKASRNWALRYAGARPGRRDAIDRRIVADAQANKARRVENLSDRDDPLAGLAVHRQRAEVPDAPFAPLSQTALLRIEAWLCLRHFAVGGPATSQCPFEQASYENALSSTAQKRS